jgi:hypothetical protein
MYYIPAVSGSRRKPGPKDQRLIVAVKRAAGSTVAGRDADLEAREPIRRSTP